MLRDAHGITFSCGLCSRSAMSKIFFSFTTNVANEFGHSPHFEDIAKTVFQIAMPCLTQFRIHEHFKKVHPGPTLISYQDLIKKCELILKNSQSVAILKYLETEPFATLKRPFATCGEWRMGWTTLF